MLISQAKPGGIARQLAMGGSNAGTNLVLNPFIIQDPAYMILNPAYQAMYADYGWANVGGGALTGSALSEGYGLQYSGLAFALNREWSVGAVLSQDPSAINVVGSLIGTIAQRPPQGIPPVLNVWEVVGAYNAGSADVGLALTYGNSNADVTNSAVDPREAEASATMWGLRGGANIDLRGGSSLDLSAAIRSDKATDKITNSGGSGGDYEATGTELQFNARANIHASNKFNFVPYGLLAIASAEPEENTFPAGGSATPVTQEVDVLVYAVGAGGEYRTQSFYFAGGISWQSAQVESKITAPAPVGATTATTTYSAIPVLNLGGEWWFTDWLAGRAGYYRSSGNLKTETVTPGNTNETNVTVPNSFVVVGGIGPANWDGLVTLGLGARFGNAALDVTVSEEALRRGLGLLGSGDNINTFGYVTMSYNWAE
ncbi:MAG: hypothetical protein HY707_10075 [Ignavibacteriae bacterium]|nr:hypothetical protein [Ignavibacteriota bacterium]